jgi:hypothetical protein
MSSQPQDKSGHRVLEPGKGAPTVYQALEGDRGGPWAKVRITGVSDTCKGPGVLEVASGPLWREFEDRMGWGLGLIKCLLWLPLGQSLPRNK